MASDAGTGRDAAPQPAVPEQVIEIVGDATPEQVAALVTVFSALSGGQDESGPAPLSRWADRSRMHRTMVHPSLNGWRASGLPG